jgi:hypothetical protein
MVVKSTLAAVGTAPARTISNAIGASIFTAATMLRREARRNAVIPKEV